MLISEGAPWARNSLKQQEQGKSEGFDSCDRPNNLARIWSKSSIFQPVLPWNLMDELGKQQGTSSILHQALCIISKPWVNTNWSYSLETLNLGQNRQFLSRVTLKFDGWPWKTIGHLFYVTSSFVYRFIAISEFKQELQSGKAQFGTKSMFFVPCDLQIWQMTLKNDRVPLLCYFKLCASFRRHWWIQTRDTVWKRPIWVKIDDFLAVWPWNLRDDIEKQ